jgi:hypothetical protein
MRAIGGRILQQQQQQQRLLLQTPDAVAMLLNPEPALLRRLAVKVPGLAKKMSKSAGGVGGSSRGGVAADAADTVFSMSFHIHNVHKQIQAQMCRVGGAHQKGALGWDLAANRPTAAGSSSDSSRP